MNLQAILRLGLTLAVAIAPGHAANPPGSALGLVHVDPSARTISFPAQVNMRAGQVEYLLVNETGKVHESIFRTAVPAAQIHAAALLFSEPGATNAAKLKVAEIGVFWVADGKKQGMPAPHLILDREKKRPLRETRWAYRGSRVVDGIFLAQRDGSLIGIMHDRDALIDQDTPDAANDQNWEPITELLPADGAGVTISIRFEK